jgi:AraC-like DNA-binding protein
VPDECTIFDFKDGFYEALLENYSGIKFFADPDWHSTLIKTNAETEFLHFYVMKLILTKSGSKLQIDSLVMKIIQKVIRAIDEDRPEGKISAKLKKNHPGTIEQAKEYIIRQFTNDISVMEIAKYCCISPFHFSRIFKTFTAFSSGFNSIEYFTSAFRQKYLCPPARFRLLNR